jgi:hypothetical protein
MDDAIERVMAKLEALAADLPPDELAALCVLLVPKDDEVSGFAMSSYQSMGSYSSMDQLNLQSAVSNRDQLESMLSNMLQAQASTAQSIVQNMKS